MQNTIPTTAGKAVLLTTMSGEALDALYDLRWMLVATLILVIADFWFGVSASVRKHVEFRFSRAGRRTTAKLIDYFTYLVVGCIVGLAITEPLGLCTHTHCAAAALTLAFIWEIDSISGHVCELHGIKKRFSIKRFLIALLKKKSPEAGEALEETLEAEETHNNSSKS